MEIDGQIHTSFTISCTSPAQWHEKDKWTCVPDWRFCDGIKVTEMRMCSAIAWQILAMIILHHGSLWLQHFTLTLPLSLFLSALFLLPCFSSLSVTLVSFPSLAFSTPFVHSAHLKFSHLSLYISHPLSLSLSSPLSAPGDLQGCSAVSEYQHWVCVRNNNHHAVKEALQRERERHGGRVRKREVESVSWEEQRANRGKKWLR